MTREEAREIYGCKSTSSYIKGGYVSCLGCPVYEGITKKCPLIRSEIPGKKADGYDDCWEYIAKVMTEREKESETMTREAIENAIKVYCKAQIACNGCKLRHVVGEGGSCYGEDADIYRNYAYLTGIHIKPALKVDHPAHYADGKYECIEVMREVYGDDAVKDFCLLNAFKYLWRCKRKHGEATTDIAKAIWYLEKYKSFEEGAKENGEQQTNTSEEGA